MDVALRVPRPRLIEVLRSPWVAVLLGVVVAKLCARPDLFSLAVVAAVLGGGALAAFRWPLPSLLGVVVVLPFLQLVQAWLWTNEIVTAEAAVRIAYVKEVVLVVAAGRWGARPRPLPSIDRWAMALVGLVGIYLLLPVGPPLEVRYVAARGDVAWVVVLLCARWLAPKPRVRALAEPLVLAGSVTIAVLAVWNRWGPDGWAGWVEGVGIIRFRETVLEAPTLGAVERVEFGDGLVIRAGSLFFTANDMAYFLLVALAVLGGRMLRRGTRPIDLAIGGLLGLAIFYSFSRSAMAMVALVGLVLAVASGRLVRGAGVLLVCGITFALLIGVLGAGDQLASGVDTEDARTSSHLDALSAGAERVVTRPLGSGLGTSSGTAIRFDVDTGLQTENFYLRTGVEMGLLGTIGSATLVVWVLVLLWRRASRDPGVVAGPLAGLAAVAAGGMVLETFSELALGWTVWLLVGLSLPANEPGASVTDR